MYETTRRTGFLVGTGCMQRRFPRILLMVGALTVLAGGCAELLEMAVEDAMADAFPSVGIDILEPARHSSGLRPEETEEPSTLICGIVGGKKTFDLDVVVTNKANGFKTVVHVATKDNELKQAKWCTVEQIPLEPGKNAILARIKGFMRGAAARVWLLRVEVGSSTGPP